MTYTDEQVRDLQLMASMPGWQIVQRWVDQQVQSATRALLDAPPTEPAKIAALQTEIRKLPAVVRHVERAIAKQMEE
jgi:hypothetical protein